MFENVHAFCAEIVRLSGEYPEATVAVWATSAILTLTQITLLLKRLAFNKVNKYADEEEDDAPDVVTVPYVPGDTVLKLLKLLEKQESGWKISEDMGGFGVPSTATLWYGSNLQITKNSSGKIEVFHKSVRIPIGKNSMRPDLDQNLLLGKFTTRLRSERARIRQANEAYALKAEDHANRELANILDTI